MPDLFPYQVEGRDFLLRNQRCMLADQPGLGKTAQSLRAVANLNADIKVCIICPRTARENWSREIKKWLGGHLLNIHLQELTSRMLITNYEQLVHETDEQFAFLNTTWDVVIIDEAHRLKNVGAKRTQIIYRHVFKAGYVWLLTGTPARNHAGELWTHLKALRPDLIPSRSGPMEYDQFLAEYCRTTHDGYGGTKVTGSKNMGTLRKIMEDGNFFLRRRKKDVLPDLPELIFDTYPLPPVKALDEETEQVLADLTVKYVQCSHMSDDEVLDFLLNPPAEFPLSSAMRALGLIKAPDAADMIHEELEAPGKIIVFYKHTDVGDILEKHLAKHDPARIEGKTKDPAAQEHKFMTDPDCRVFLGQINACQEAINLTVADQCLFVEASWSPSDNEQAACRGHRIGMQEGYVVRFLTYPNTLDDIVMRVCARKADELYQLFG